MRGERLQGRIHVLPVLLGQLCCDAEGCCLGEVGRALNPSGNAAGGAATPPCSSPFSLQSQPFIPSSCTQRCSSAGIASPSIQLLFLSPPEASKGCKSAAMCKYWRAVRGGLVTWQLKYLTYILLSISKVRWSSASSQNFFPKEFQCCCYFCWNRLLLNIKGRAQGLDLWGCGRAGPPSRDFGGAGRF